MACIHLVALFIICRLNEGHAWDCLADGHRFVVGMLQQACSDAAEALAGGPSYQGACTSQCRLLQPRQRPCGRSRNGNKSVMLLPAAIGRHVPRRACSRCRSQGRVRVAASSPWQSSSRDDPEGEADPITSFEVAPLPELRAVRGSRLPRQLAWACHGQPYPPHIHWSQRHPPSMPIVLHYHTT